MVYSLVVRHWVSPYPIHFDLPNSIVVFDLTAEEFRELPQPYCIDGNEIGDKKTTLDMGLLEGCPCVVCNYDSV